ncbi:SseB family protein [Streptomyces sp. NPDC057654]|uniref:SseB family protein n=1 Tax=Streptomyces sp. NPDC057654 TaxID=3346196 RepID=UPI0036C64E34
MSLRDLVQQEAVASMTPAERLAQLCSARLYFQRPEQPGFFVAETLEGPVAPVFTSWEGLALFAGACEWASTTAADLVELLPEGVGVLVDPLGPRPFVLDADAVMAGASADAVGAEHGSAEATEARG